jgi:hypothetical protein
VTRFIQLGTRNSQRRGYAVVLLPKRFFAGRPALKKCSYLNGLYGAANRTRTCDPVITNDVLYQLSYCGGPSGAFGNYLKTPAPDIGHGPIWQEKRGRPT